MVTTILELTEAFFGGGGVGVAKERGPGGGGEAAVTDAFKEYIRVASFVLLRLKLRQQFAGNSGSGSSSAPGFKFFCMYAFLDKFVEECQQVSSLFGGRGGLVEVCRTLEISFSFISRGFSSQVTTP